MTDTTNTTTSNIPSDPFDFFLSLEDGGDNKAMKETVNRLRDERATEKANSPTTEDVELDLASLGIDEIKDDSGDYDFSFLDENNPIFEDEEEWQDPNATPEPEEGEEEDSGFQEEETETNDSADGDDSPIDYGESVELDYSDLVTLPSGLQVTLQDLADRYTNDVDFDARLQHVAAEEERIKQLSDSYTDSLRLARLETDVFLEDFKNVDWNRLGMEDPVTFTENKLLYDDMVAKKQRIIDRFIQQEHEEKAAAEAKFNADASNAVQILKREIPEWSNNLYSDILNHMIDNGVPQDVAEKEISVPTIKAWYRDMKATKANITYKAKVQRPKGVTKSFSASAKSVNVAEEAKKAKIAQAYKEGRISNSQVFDFLED